MVGVHGLLTTSFIAYLSHCDFFIQGDGAVHELFFANVIIFTNKSHKGEATAK